MDTISQTSLTLIRGGNPGQVCRGEDCSSEAVSATGFCSEHERENHANRMQFVHMRSLMIAQRMDDCNTGALTIAELEQVAGVEVDEYLRDRYENADQVYSA